MFITNNPEMAQFYIDDYEPEWISRVCFHRKQYYIYYQHDRDVVPYHPQTPTVKKTKIVLPNVGLFEPFVLDKSAQMYLFNFPKGVVTCNEDSIITSVGKTFNLKDYLHNNK